MTETHRAWPTSSRTSSASSAAVGAPHPGESVLEKPAVEVAPDMLVDETAPEVEVGFDTPIQGCRTRTPSPIRRRAGLCHRDARRLLQRWRESLAGSRSRQRSTANARSMARRVGAAASGSGGGAREEHGPQEGQWRESRGFRNPAPLRHQPRRGIYIANREGIILDAHRALFSMFGISSRSCAGRAPPT